MILLPHKWAYVERVETRQNFEMNFSSTLVTVPPILKLLHTCQRANA